MLSSLGGISSALLISLLVVEGTEAGCGLTALSRVVLGAAASVMAQNTPAAASSLRIAGRDIPLRIVLQSLAQIGVFEHNGFALRGKWLLSKPRTGLKDREKLVGATGFEP